MLLDGLQTEVTAVVGEPYRIRIPFKGSPVPTATWHNVSLLFGVLDSNMLQFYNHCLLAIVKSSSFICSCSYFDITVCTVYYYM